jgi:hypothetical protein
MLLTLARRAIFAILFCSPVLFAQEKPAGGVHEFPVTMKQNVVAGKTAVGTKVQAKLAVATLVDGVVIPRNAVFSGEVVESVAKTSADASRLAIRMDSVQWKKGTAPVRVYLTAWYYPVRAMASVDLAFGPSEGPISKTWNGAGTYPDPSSPASQPFPGREQPKAPEVTPLCTASCIADHPSLMKDVQSTRTAAGNVAISSSRLNIKLDKMTTYVLANGDLIAGK